MEIFSLTDFCTWKENPGTGVQGFGILPYIKTAGK